MPISDDGEYLVPPNVLELDTRRLVEQAAQCFGLLMIHADLYDRLPIVDGKLDVGDGQTLPVVRMVQRKPPDITD